MGVPQSTVVRWEGGRMPRREHAARYAGFLRELDQISRAEEPAES